MCHRRSPGDRPAKPAPTCTARPRRHAQRQTVAWPLTLAETGPSMRPRHQRAAAGITARRSSLPQGRLAPTKQVITLPSYTAKRCRARPSPEGPHSGRRQPAPPRSNTRQRRQAVVGPGAGRAGLGRRSAIGPQPSDGEAERGPHQRRRILVNCPLRPACPHCTASWTASQCRTMLGWASTQWRRGVSIS